MALFKKKTKKVSDEKKNEAAETVKVVSQTEKKEPEIKGINTVFPDIILRPRITEKATDVQQQNVYVFEIDSKANKKSVSREFQRIYKITPAKINITKNPGKRVIVRGKRGKKRTVKKAYVYLKEGENITV